MKWFITDMDGTFLNDKKEIAPNAKEVMAELTKKNIKFIIATGRADIAIKHYYHDLGMEDVVISNNGSLIRNLKTGEIIFRKSFTDYELETIWKMFKEFDNEDIAFHFYTLNYIYCDKLSRSLERMKRVEKNRPEELKTPMIIVEGDTLEKLKENSEVCQKIMMLSENHEKLERFYEMVSEVLDVDGTFSATDFFDIMPSGCNKGSAIHRLAEYYGYKVEDSVAFGDNLNDEEMLKAAGTAVCPNNAREEIKTICDEIIGNNNEFSVLKYVEDYAKSVE